VLDRRSLVRRKLLKPADLKALLPGWRLAVHDVLGSADLHLELTRSERQLRLTLCPDPAKPAFRRTQRFGLSYAAPEFDAETSRVLDAVAWLVARSEGVLSEAELVLLSRGYALIDGVLSARLTLGCNERCTFCFASDDAPENIPDLVIDHARLVADLPLLASLGVRRLLLTGGEPTLVPALPGLVRAARRAGFTDIELQTNARRFADPRFAAALEGALPDRAFVSFYAVTQAAYERLGRTHADLEERFAGLGVLLDLGVPTVVNLLLLRDTLAEVGAFVDLLHRRYGRRLDVLTFSMVAPFGLAWASPEQIPRLGEVAAALGPALVAAEAWGYRPQIPAGCSLPACVLPELTRFFLSAEGQPQQAREGKSKPPSCRRCRLDRLCPGVWSRYRDLHGDGELVPL